MDAIARNDEEEAAAAMDEHLRYMEYRIELKPYDWQLNREL